MDILVAEGEKVLRDAIDRIKIPAFQREMWGKFGVMIEVRNGRVSSVEDVIMPKKTFPNNKEAYSN